jgi:UPF0755 protein
MTDQPGSESPAAATSSRSVPKKGTRSRARRGCLAVLALLAVLLLVAALVVWWSLYRVENPTASGKQVLLQIQKGETMSQIASDLAKRGVVANANMFRVQARLDGADSRLKPGTYDLETGMDYTSVIDALTIGSPVTYVNVTVPEGWTIPQIADRLEKEAGIPAEEFVMAARTGRGHYNYPFLESDEDKSLEGYLFPKTYRIREGSTAEEVVRLMLQQFGRETAGIDMRYAESRNLTFHDVVTIASMIEREAKVQRDRPLVGSVIYNRLRRGMLLEIDATVQYVVGYKPRLLYRDLRVESPYNTYLHAGLPPGPIANPGLASIRAAAHPAETDYYFYVLTHRDGRHSFAATEAEFQRLKARARMGLR